AGRGADEPMGGLCDHEWPALPHDARRLAEDRLDLTRIPLVSRELDRLLRRLQTVDADHAPLRLRHGLLREDDHVAGLELDTLDDHGSEVVVLPDRREPVHGDERDHSTPTPVTRTPACAL